MQWCFASFLRSFLFLFLLFLQTFSHIAMGDSSKEMGLSDHVFKDLVHGKDVKVSPGAKGTVLVFLSIRCPCSHGHMQILKDLSKDFTDFSFYGVHSNTDEDLSLSQKYFLDSKLPFPVIQDDQAKLADHFRAFKTPHAFILSAPSHGPSVSPFHLPVVYRGGVTSSSQDPASGLQYLRNALMDLQKGNKVGQPETRTLGCHILRKSNNPFKSKPG